VDAPVLELARILAEGFLALLADEDHLEALQEGVVFFFLVARGTVEPLLAAGRADRDLGVEDVFAHGDCMCCVYVGEVVLVQARPWGGCCLDELLGCSVLLVVALCSAGTMFDCGGEVVRAH
jgi:hypothetical protein